MHPERASARSAVVFNTIAMPIAILLLAICAVAVFGAVAGAWHIPALEHMR